MCSLRSSAILFLISNYDEQKKDPMKKLRIGVLMGGKSIEREVSFNSGRTICDHLDSMLYDIIPIFQSHEGTLWLLPWRFLYRGKISDFEHRLNEAKQISWDDLKDVIDFIYIATHGRFAEDGSLQGMLEVLGIPYLGSKVYASALCMDKILQKDVLRTHGIDVPNGIMIPAHQIAYISSKEILAELKKINVEFPLIIRPQSEGSSLGVSVVFEENALIPTIMTAAKIDPHRTQGVLIEEKLEGLEFCSVILTDPETRNPLALPFTEILPENNTHIFDYEQKYMPGRSVQFTPARCSKQDSELITQVCIKTMKALEVTNIIRIDGFLTNDKRVVIIDPNTLTGMGPSTFLFRQAAHKNFSHTDLINHLIKTELISYKISSTTSYNHNLYAGAKMNVVKSAIPVAVLFGGRSREKEISLESGRNIIYKLSPEKYDAIPLFVDKNLNLYKINQKLLVCHATSEIEEGLETSMRIPWSKLPQIANFVFIGLHGGEGENGCIQGTLEMLGIPYNGSGVLTSSLCMDKYKTNQFLKQKGFDVPKNLLISHVEWKTAPDTVIEKIANSFIFPLIIKPHDDGCSVFVQKIDKVEQVKNALNKLFTSEKTHAFVEEYIKGMELTVGVIGNENPHVFPPSQAVAQKGILSIEEKFLPGTGENQTPAPLSDQAIKFVQKIIKDVYVALNCKGYARIDCFYQTPQESLSKQERIVIIEVNTLPGLTPATCLFHQAAEEGMKPMDLIDHIITLGFEQHADKSQKKERINLMKEHI